MIRGTVAGWLGSISILALIAVASIQAEDTAERISDTEGGYHCKWSPNGKYIAFTSRRSGEAKIFIVPAGGEGASRAETGLAGDHWFTWTPDSKNLAFDAYGRNGPPPRMWFIPVSGGDAEPILPDVVPSFHPTVSPDGEWIAFTALMSGNADIWKARLNGDSLTQLTRDPHTDHHPQWTPDGRSIVFSSERSGNWDIWIVGADGAQEKRLTDAPEKDDHACVSPDGRLIAFMSRRSGKRDIWLMSIDGGQARQFTQEGKNAWPSFSPDSRKLVWSSDRNGQINLYVGEITDD